MALNTKYDTKIKKQKIENICTALKLLNKIYVLF